MRGRSNVYHGPMYRVYISNCGKFTWGYSTVLCNKCIGKRNPQGRKACFCEPTRCSKAHYDAMWSHYLLLHTPGVYKHRLPPKPRQKPWDS